MKNAVTTVDVTENRGKAKGTKGYGKADIIPGVSIRLYGVRYPGTKHEVPYDITFKLGDTAEYGSYNLIYTGKITSITTKGVSIQEPYAHNPKTHRLSLHTFEWRNYDFDAAAIAEQNAATSQCI